MPSVPPSVIAFLRERYRRFESGFLQQRVGHEPHGQNRTRSRPEPKVRIQLSPEPSVPRRRSTGFLRRSTIEPGSPRQIPIDGQALTAFLRVRSSEAFRRRPPILRQSLASGRHPKPFTIPAVRMTTNLTAGFDPKGDIARVHENGVTVEARSNVGVVFMSLERANSRLSPHHAPRELTRRQAG